MKKNISVRLQQQKFPSKISPNADYFLLLIGVAVTLCGYYFSWPDHSWQKSYALLLGVYYFSWSVWHHHRHGKISKELLTEYFALAILSVLVLWLAVE